MQYIRITPLLLLNIFALVSILGLSAFTLQQDYQKHIQAAEENTRFVASLVARQAESTIEELDQLLHSIAIQLQLNNSEVSPTFIDDLDVFLSETKAYNSQIMDLLVLDSYGQITAWTGKGLPPLVTDREYARVHLNSRSTDLYIGEPLLSKVHPGQWFFAISKAVRNTEGDLQQVLVAIVDIEKFQSLISSIERPEFSSLALISKSGTIVTRVPGHEKHVGTKIELPYDVLYRKNAGNFDALSPFDGVERVVGYKHLDQINITAFSTLSRNVILDDWYDLRNFVLMLDLVIFSFIVWLNLKIRHERTIIELQRAQLSKQARTDELTGLYNRRHIMQMLHDEFKLAKLNKSNFALLMVDIDHFKSINDQYGHDVGDAVLREVADIMIHVSRKGTIMGRIGGEEFLFVLPSTSREDATHLAERIRESVYNSTIVIEDVNVTCTVSIGIADCNFKEQSYTEAATIKHADEAMYTAKNTGRNKVVSYIASPMLS